MNGTSYLLKIFASSRDNLYEAIVFSTRLILLWLPKDLKGPFSFPMVVSTTGKPEKK